MFRNVPGCSMFRLLSTPLKNCIEPPSYASTAYVVAIWSSFLFDSFVKIWGTCDNFLGKWSTAPPGKKIPVRLCLGHLDHLMLTFRDIKEGLRYIKQGMIERFADPSHPLLKQEMEPIETYQNRKESQTLEELAQIEGDENAITEILYHEPLVFLNIHLVPLFCTGSLNKISK